MGMKRNGKIHKGHTVYRSALDPEFAQRLEAYEARKRAERGEKRRVVKMPVFSIQRDKIGAV